MQDILKYWPITFDYSGKRMSVPMGEIIGIKAFGEACTILTRNDDSWTTDTVTYEEVMEQWKKAFNSLGSGLYL